MTGAQPLNALAVQRRLRAIEDRLDELGQLGEVPVQRLRDDWLVRAAVERVLIELVEHATQINTQVVAASGKLPATSYKESFGAASKAGVIPAELAARIAPSASLRNVLVHRYLDADLSRVADAVPMARKDYGEYVREVSGWLVRQQPE
jgi:uncharacterized protein YutE (UPF0331/DUF86 family)